MPLEAQEASYFAARLGESDLSVSALIVNRVHPRFGEDNPDALHARAAELHDDAPRLATLYDRLADPREEKPLPMTTEARAMAAELQRSSDLMRDLYRRDQIQPAGWGPAGPPTLTFWMNLAIKDAPA